MILSISISHERVFYFYSNCIQNVEFILNVLLYILVTEMLAAVTILYVFKGKLDILIIVLLYFRNKTILTLIVRAIFIVH